ncbi:uncharacterized protein LOC132259996 [Phlebotomus argentipes]|uniref:uncharacterized protein LOC132259996 n=1 Tax=Phlebotomus argentipes TaxID=94469 RepID=UPI0028932170|nr:uncharacterized protein LOC132259996 [Phlebotomus argentipes]
MKKTALIFLLLVAIVTGQEKKCSDVVPQQDFQVDLFLGNWYVIQQTKTESRCVKHQITPLEKAGEYRISQVSPHYLLDKLHVQHEHTYAGFLVADSVSPARMTARYALSFGDEAYIIVTTDYDTYAGVLVCGALGPARTATILSRTQSLSEQQLYDIRQKLAGFGVKISDLSTISHKNCPVDGIDGINIKIGHDLLYPDRIRESAEGIFKDIGQAVGGALENGAKFFNGFFNRKSRASRAI